MSSEVWVFYLLVSVKGRNATIEYDDCPELDKSGKRYVVKIADDCGTTPAEMARHVGERMKIDIEWDSMEILDVGELTEDSESDCW